VFLVDLWRKRGIHFVLKQLKIQKHLFFLWSTKKTSHSKLCARMALKQSAVSLLLGQYLVKYYIGAIVIYKPLGDFVNITLLIVSL
jgi:hypothetical protein